MKGATNMFATTKNTEEALLVAADIVDKEYTLTIEFKNIAALLLGTSI